MGSVARKLPLLARTGWEQNSRLTWRFLAEYGMHDRFTKALEHDLYREMLPHLRTLPDSSLWHDVARWQGSTQQWLPYEIVPNVSPEYVAEVAKFAHRWGLDRLPDAQGLNAVHGWLISKRHYGRRVNPKDFGSWGMGFGGFLPQAPEMEPVSLPETIHWDPTSETRETAKRRILGEIAREVDRALDSIVSYHEAVGYQFPDTESALPRHMHWLYLRLGRRLTCDEIAGEAANPRSVRNATARLASRLGISLTDR